jgi:hypothetical protein
MDDLQWSNLYGGCEMKATTKIPFILCLLLFSSLALTAQKSLLVQDVKPMMAFTPDPGSNIELSGEYRSGSYQFYFEERIQLSSWMINREQWHAEEGRGLTTMLRPEREPVMVLRSWMVEPLQTEPVRLTELVKTDPEPPIKLEKWMYCCQDWKIVSL